VLLSVVVDVTTAGAGPTGAKGVVELDVTTGVVAAAGASATGALEPLEAAPVPVVTGVAADPVPSSPGSVLVAPPVAPVASGGTAAPGCVLVTGAGLG
jgi:hypothetical protein